MKFKDIKQFPNIYYHVDIPIKSVTSTIERYILEYHLNTNPDF